MPPMRALACATFALALIAGGCPGPDGPGAVDLPPPEAPPPDAPDPNAPKDPLAGSVFGVAEVQELYAAEQAGEPARTDVLTRHRLLDASGAEVPARVEAYERALQRYAQEDPEGWSSFVDSLPR